MDFLKFFKDKAKLIENDFAERYLGASESEIFLVKDTLITEILPTIEEMFLNSSFSVKNFYIIKLQASFNQLSLDREIEPFLLKSEKFTNFIFDDVAIDSLSSADREMCITGVMQLYMFTACLQGIYNAEQFNLVEFETNS